MLDESWLKRHTEQLIPRHNVENRATPLTPSLQPGAAKISHLKTSINESPEGPLSNSKHLE